MSGDIRSVVVTGASRGIGHAIARRFLAEGWRVITCARADVPKECMIDRNWACHIVADLADAASAQNFINRLETIVTQMNENVLGTRLNDQGCSGGCG